MFKESFEKNATFYYPGRAGITRAGGHLTRAAGNVLSALDPKHGGLLHAKGTRDLHFAEKLTAERKAPAIAANLKAQIERRNTLREAQGKKVRTYKDKTIARHAKAEAVKKSMSLDTGKPSKEKSFISKHPRTSLAIGIGGTYALTRPSTQSNDNPQLGQY